MNKKQDIRITGASTLSSDEVDRMVNEAEKFASEDKEKREAVDIKNQADSTAYQTEKQITELGDKVPQDVKAKVEAKLKDLKDAIASESTEAMKTTQEALQQEVMAMGQSMYSQEAPADGQAPPPPGAGGPPPPGAGSSS